MVTVFANGLGDMGSIPGQVIPKTQKMVLDAYLLNTQHYKVWNNGNWSNPRNVVATSPTPRVVAIEMGVLGLPLTTISQHTSEELYVAVH